MLPADLAVFDIAPSQLRTLHTTNIAVQRESGYRSMMTIGIWRSPGHAGVPFPCQRLRYKGAQNDKGLKTDLALRSTERLPYKRNGSISGALQCSIESLSCLSLPSRFSRNLLRTNTRDLQHPELYRTPIVQPPGGRREQRWSSRPGSVSGETEPIPNR
jgi:hypothetical protein